MNADRATPDAPAPLDALAGVPAEALWLRPLGLVRGAAASALADEEALPLAGAAIRFTHVEAMALNGGVAAHGAATLAGLRRWARAAGDAVARRVDEQLSVLSAKRPSWAGFSLARPLVMGILNVTPDSFSDGGDFATPERAIVHGKTMLAAGANIIDVGGESTRPGALAVSIDEEIARTAPVVAALAEAGALVSIDTRHAAVMEAAIAKGARIVNDVTGLTGDPDSPALVARHQVDVVLMHMRGEPHTMQNDPTYVDATIEVTEYLAARIAACAAAGIPQQRIAIDPGIGFGKTALHNLQILERIALLHALGCPILLGISRKSVIGRITNAMAAKDRLPGSLAGALHGLEQGVQIVRVHDVAETRQAIAVADAIAASTLE